MPKTAKEIVTRVPIKRLRPNPWQSEVGSPLSNGDYAMLKTSIERHGIQIPLVVWRRGKQLLGGYRVLTRLDTARMAVNHKSNHH